MKGYYEICNRFYYPTGLRYFMLFVMCIVCIPAYFHPKIFLFYPLGLFIFLCRGGTQVDFAEGFIRDYKKMLGQKLGKWELLPEIDYIALHRVTEQFGQQSLSGAESHTEEFYKVNLVYEKNKVITLYSSDFYEPAYKIAKEVSTASGLRVFITDGESKPRWM